MLATQLQKLGILGHLRGSLTRQVVSLQFFSQAAVQEGDTAGVSLTGSAIQRLQHLLATKARPDEKALRLTVEAGGCSGFSYRCAQKNEAAAKIPQRLGERIHAYRAISTSLLECMVWIPDKSVQQSVRFDLDPGPKEGDAVFAYDGAQLVVDSVSLEFVRGATIDYAAELIKSNFEVVANPNAEGSCGCGSSFNPKGM